MIFHCLQNQFTVENPAIPQRCTKEHGGTPRSKICCHLGPRSWICAYYRDEVQVLTSAANIKVNYTSFILPRQYLPNYHFKIRGFRYLIAQKIENIIQAGGLAFVHLGKLASGAGHCCVVFILDVEELGEAATGCHKPVGFKFPVSTFGTFPVFMLHE